MTAFPRPTTIELFHLPTTAGEKQPYPGSADVTVTGSFLPLDRKDHALEGGEYSDPHEIYLPSDTDIRVGDKAVISSTTYFVKHVFRAQFGGHAHKRAVISAEVS